MTDRMDNPAPETPEKAPVRGGQKRVFTYIAILFTLAFILLLWSALSSRSSSQLVLSELKGNAAALQTTADALQTTLAENAALTSRVEALENELAQAQDTLKTTQAALAALSVDYTTSQETVAGLTETVARLSAELDEAKAALAAQETPG